MKVHLNTKVTPQLVREHKPDSAIVATGSIPKKLDVKGANGKNVIQANDVILGKAEIGETVVVVGGRHLGLEIADQLAIEKKKSLWLPDVP